jgi:P pilus assembly chaperone PapD
MLMVSQANAAAQLMVSPTRIVFEGSDRTKQVNLINNGSDTGRFRISFVRRTMLESGQIEAADEGEPGMYSDDMVRFAPRQVTLEPGQSQTVRLMLRKKSGLEDGEYRSHLMFQSLPDSATSDIEELASDRAKGVSVQLIPVVGITIPVIVRQGQLHSSAELSDFEIKQSNTVKGESSLSLKINRTGNESVYGDFRIYFTPKGGKPLPVGQVNGVAVYTPLERRSIEIKLNPPKGYSLEKGELHVTYLKPGEDETSGLLAEARLAIP